MKKQENIFMGSIDATIISYCCKSSAAKSNARICRITNSYMSSLRMSAIATACKPAHLLRSFNYAANSNITHCLQLQRLQPPCQRTQKRDTTYYPINALGEHNFKQTGTQASYFATGPSGLLEVGIPTHTQPLDALPAL
ncbi:MAG: hypothetical protein Q4B94_08210 [Pseudomonadota bacterium]|nr:hypothetical protein [Pseudomonadota bacterium]